MSQQVTRPVDGTFALVTYDPESYLNTNVYLHDAATPWYDGVVVGTVGSMVRHGNVGNVYATERHTPFPYRKHDGTVDKQAHVVSKAPRHAVVERMVAAFMADETGWLAMADA